jgi:cell shape-determining protein MreC
MDARAFRTALEANGLGREVSDAIVDYVDDQKSDLVTGQKLELEMTRLRAEMAELRGELRAEMAELRGELRGEMAELKTDLKTDFANHKTEMTRLVLGTSGALGLLIIALRFLPN